MALTVLAGSLTAALAISCWYAAARGLAWFPAVKVAALAALLLTAWAWGAADVAGGVALLVGLGFSLIGDALLLSSSTPAFMGGLSAFLAAHLAYVVAFASRGWSLLGVVVAAACVAPFAVRSFPRVRRAAVGAGGPMLGHAVTAYAAAILAMALAAGGTGLALVLIGAVAFVVSDTVLGLDRFDAPRAQAHLVVMASYHVAQGAIVVGLLS